MTELLHLSLPVMLARATRSSAAARSAARAVAPHGLLGVVEGRDWVLGCALGSSMGGKGPSHGRSRGGLRLAPGGGGGGAFRALLDAEETLECSWPWTESDRRRSKCFRMFRPDLPGSRT